jgi:hypothetical protein
MFKVTTPCAVCAAEAQIKQAPSLASRGLDWPLTKVAGHTVHKTCARDLESLVRHATDGTLVIEDGVGRWTTNGHAIPVDVAAQLAAFGLAPGLDLAATKAVSDVETADAIQRYRDRQPAEASAEEVAEMRAAFGPGAEVADVITGRRTQL